MKKRSKIIYWFTTFWLALGMASTGIVQLIKMDEEVAMMTRLAYPAYFLTILGVWKILGVIVILIPKFAWSISTETTCVLNSRIVVIYGSEFTTHNQ